MPVLSAVPSRPDGFTFNMLDIGNPDVARGWNGITTRTLVRSPVADGETTLVGVFGPAQSHDANSILGPEYVVTHADQEQILNLNIFDGGFYVADGPVLGTVGNGDHFARPLMDRLYDLAPVKPDKLVIVGNAVSGTTSGQWANGICTHRIDAMFARIAAAGLTVDFIHIDLGATDALPSVNTPYATQLANYQTIVARVRLYTNAPIFMNLTTYVHGAFPLNWVNIRNAQQALINLDPTVHKGHDTDPYVGNRYGVDPFPAEGLNDTYRNDVDESHFNNLGRDIEAAVLANRIAQLIL